MACSTSTSTSCNTARCSPTCPCSHVCTHLHTYYKLHMYPVRTYSTYSCGCLGCAFFQSGAGMPLPHCSQSGLVPRLARLAGIVGAASAKKTRRTRPLQNAAIPAHCLPAVEYLVRILPQPALGLGTSIPTSPDSLTASSQGLLFTYPDPPPSLVSTYRGPTSHCARARGCSLFW